jgi:hypothetical protein
MDLDSTWQKDMRFWEIYCQKTKNYNVGPLATMTNDSQQQKLWRDSSKDIYKKYKGKEESIPVRYPRCP